MARQSVPTQKIKKHLLILQSNSIIEKPNDLTKRPIERYSKTDAGSAKESLDSEEWKLPPIHLTNFSATSTL